MDTSNFVPSTYALSLRLSQYALGERHFNLDSIRECVIVKVLSDESFNRGLKWEPEYWGYVKIPDLTLIEEHTSNG